MPYHASITIMGHVGFEAETRAVGSSGKSVTTISVGTKNWGKPGEAAVYSNYKCQTWNDKMADRLKGVQKKDLVLITGRPEIQTFKDKEGKERMNVVIDVQGLENITGAERYKNGSGARDQSPTTPETPPGPATVDADDLPF